MQYEHWIRLTVCIQKCDVDFWKFLFYNQTDLQAQRWWNGSKENEPALCFCRCGHRGSEWISTMAKVTKVRIQWLSKRGPTYSISIIWELARVLWLYPDLLNLVGGGHRNLCLNKLPGDSDAANV